MKKILFFLNKRSGTGLRSDIENEITSYFSSDAFKIHISRLETGHDFSGISDYISELEPDIVVAGGGDGTINAVASHAIEYDIPLGILPLGSTNSLAYELGIPSGTQNALELIAEGSTRAIDFLEIDNKQICLHMCDFGMNARVIKRRESEAVKGFFGYAYQYFKELGKRKKIKVKIKSGDRELIDKATMVIIANASYFGTGAEFSPKSDLEDGVFEVVIVHAYSASFLFQLFLSIFKKNNENNKLSETHQFTEAVIEAFPPEDLQIDGEPVGKRDCISVKIRKKGLKVLSPH